MPHLYISLHLNNSCIMNRLILITLIICLSPALFAQAPDQQGQVNKMSRHEQVLSAKIAFFTTELELTPKEAAAFWPVYNQYWDERMNAHRRIMRNLSAIRKILEEKKPNYEESLKRIMDAYINSQAIEGMIFRKYYEEFQKVLPIDKVAKIYRAEEDFRGRLINDLRKGGGDR